MAAVKTTGVSTCTSKESAKALSSSVSVPWVITMPKPVLAAAVAASAIAAMSASVKSALGFASTSSASTSARSARRGTAPTRFAAQSVIAAPPGVVSVVMAMVPPVERMIRRARGIRCSIFAKGHARTAANPQAGAGSRRFGSYQNVSRETFWYDLGQKPYKASDSRSSFNLVRSIDFLVQFQEGGDGASMVL